MIVVVLIAMVVVVLIVTVGLVVLIVVVDLFIPPRIIRGSMKARQQIPFLARSLISL